MTAGELTAEIFRSFGYAPSQEQLAAVNTFADFMLSPSSDSLMLMRGSAGSGKTAIASAIVKTMHLSLIHI